MFVAVGDGTQAPHDVPLVCTLIGRVLRGRLVGTGSGGLRVRLRPRVEQRHGVGDVTVDRLAVFGPERDSLLVRTILLPSRCELRSNFVRDSGAVSGFRSRTASRTTVRETEQIGEKTHTVTQ